MNTSDLIIHYKKNVNVNNKMLSFMIHTDYKGSNHFAEKHFLYFILYNFHGSIFVHKYHIL